MHPFANVATSSLGQCLLSTLTDAFDLNDSHIVSISFIELLVNDMS